MSKAARVHYRADIRGIKRRPIARTSLKKAPSPANLQRGHVKPALGNGRLQRRAMRVLWLFGTVTTADVVDWAYAVKRHKGMAIALHDRNSAARALRSIGAQRVARGAGRGRPWLWALSEDPTEALRDDAPL